jgi:hypothetical protein
VSDPAEDVPGGDPHVVEEDLVEVRAAVDLVDRAQRHPGRAQVDDEHRDALVLGHVGVGACDHDAEVAVLGAGRPDLLAVQDPLVTVGHGAGGEPRDVGAGAGFGEELTPHLLAPQHRPDIALLLLLRATAKIVGPHMPSPMM